MNKNLNIEDKAKILKISYIKKNYKQLINEAISTLGSEGGSDNLLLAMRLHHEFLKHNKKEKKVK